MSPDGRFLHLEFQLRMRLPLWPEREQRWRHVDLPLFLGHHTGYELRIRDGFRKLSVGFLVGEAKVTVLVHRQRSWFTWDSPAWFFWSPQNFELIADLRQIEPSVLFSAIVEVLRKNDWNSRDARDAHRILERILHLARDREQRLLALPPAMAVPWSEPVREDQWSMGRSGRHVSTTGSIEVTLHYNWEPRYGSGASARWHIVSTRVGGAPRQSSGRDPLDGICCDQAVGDLEDWGWPRAKALSIGRAISETALRDWIALKPEIESAWRAEFNS